MVIKSVPRGLNLNLNTSSQVSEIYEIVKNVVDSAQSAAKSAQDLASSALSTSGVVATAGTSKTQEANRAANNCQTVAREASAKASSASTNLKNNKLLDAVRDAGEVSTIVNNAVSIANGLITTSNIVASTTRNTSIRQQISIAIKNTSAASSAAANASKACSDLAISAIEILQSDSEIELDRGSGQLGDVAATAGSLINTVGVVGAGFDPGTIPVGDLAVGIGSVLVTGEGTTPSETNGDTPTTGARQATYENARTPDVPDTFFDKNLEQDKEEEPSSPTTRGETPPVEEQGFPDFAGTGNPVTCPAGTINIGGKCVPISPSEPPPNPPVESTTENSNNLPDGSGNNVSEDVSQTVANVFFQSSRCVDEVVSPPPTQLPPDPNQSVAIQFPRENHIYVLQNKVGTEQDYIDSPYLASEVDDTIRASTGYFWYFEDRKIKDFENKLIPVYRNENSLGLIRYLNTFPNTRWVSNKEQNSINLENIKNNVALSNIQNFNIPSPIFEDFVFRTNMAIDSLENESRSIPSQYYYKSESQYNYYVGSYEKLLNSPESPSILDLPNYYLLRQEEESAEEKQYYDNYVADWLNRRPRPKEKTKNILFECDVGIEAIEENLVPFFNKISFSLEKDNRLVYNQLGQGQDRKNLLNFLLFVMFTIEEKYDLAEFTKLYSYQNFRTLEREIVKEIFSIKYNSSSDETDAGIKSILNIASQLLLPETDIGDLFSKFTLIKKDLNINNKEELNLLYDLSSENIGIDSFLNSQRKRFFKDILQGKLCYSETFFYKIEKYEEGTTEPVQNIWIINDEKDIFEYIDTQIKYGVNYTYVVKSYKYVLGNKYQYLQKQLVSSSPRLGVNYKIDFENNIEVNFVATEYARISAISLDKPPPSPEVDIIPYKDNNQKVLVLLNPSSVQYKREPVSFNEEERQFYNTIIKDGKVTFGGDDKTRKYYVYRIEEPPSSYQDFADALYAEIEPECNCTTAEYIQDLEANKKYYFVFRSVDVHGHISYPTQPFLVELINEGGTTFLDFRGVDFINKEYKSLTKGAKRFIHIKPNLQQSLLRITQENNSAISAIERNGYELGQEDVQKKLWDKNFKLKIKSKNTNKEINIKFKFVQKENKDLIRNLEESCE